MKQEKCKIAQAHKRLLESHRLWHQANDQYFDPDGFRTNVNATIQAIRNLTFALQNCKGNIPRFDEWYNKWVEEMKEDAIMKWLCNARTEIVHKKDLKIYSVIDVSINSYETILKDKIEIPLFVSGKKLLNYLLEEGVIKEEWRSINAYAKIERKWVVNDFPQYDILYLLAYGIGFLYNMVSEAHLLGGVNIDSCSVIDTIHPIRVIKLEIPTCMQCIDKTRTEQIGLSDFMSRQLEFNTVCRNSKLDKEILRRYKKIIRTSNINKQQCPFEFAEAILEMGKQVLVQDGYHNNLLWYRDKDMNWNLIESNFADQTSKYMFWQEIAHKVELENINSIIFMGESWIGNFEQLKEKGLRPSEQLDKKEAFILDVYTNDLKGKSYITPFERGFLNKIKLKGTNIIEITKFMGYISPIIDVWKKIF